MADNGSADLQPKKIGGYKILKLIAEGGMGRVYRAKKGRREVAIKILNGGIDQDHGKQLFAKEQELLEVLKSSEHIVGFIETGVHEGRPYLVLELLDGLTLQQLIDQRDKPLDAKDVLEITLGICKALVDIHGAGIVHRDLKPGNIMLVLTNQGSRVVVIDFNIGEWFEKLAYESDMAMGTPIYMAPEQARGEALNEKCDIFSLGCILYEMLTLKWLVGQPSDNRAVIEAHARMTSAPIGDRPSNVSPELWEILKRTLHTNPEARPSAADLVKKLERILDGKKLVLPELPKVPTVSKTPTPGIRVNTEETLPPPPQRRSWVAVGMGVMMACLLLFIGSLKLYALVMPGRQEPRIYSDTDLTVTVPLTPAPTPDRTDEPPQPVVNEEPRPAPPRPIRTRSVQPQSRSAHVTRPVIHGIPRLQNGNYQIPHPEDWRYISPHRRHALCATFRAQGVHGRVFDDFCRNW